MQYTFQYTEVRTKAFTLDIDGTEEEAKSLASRLLDYDKFYSKVWADEDDVKCHVELVEDRPCEDWTEDVSEYLSDPRLVVNL